MELHYSDGGHGGPYANLADAIDGAERYIRSLMDRRHSLTVTIREYVAGPAVMRVHGYRSRFDGSVIIVRGA
jgi:hypothetical protein